MSHLRIGIAIALAGLAVALGGACRGVNYVKPKGLNYDEMGLETHHRGLMGSPEVGAPDEERLGHEKTDKLRDPKKSGAGTGAPATSAPTAAPATAAPAPPAPAVTGEAPKVEYTGKSDLGADAIAATLAGADGAVKGCYEKALAGTPGLGGTVAVKLVVNKDGKVASAEVASSTLGNPDAEKCVVAAVKALAFAKSKAAGSASVTKAWSLRLESPK